MHKSGPPEKRLKQLSIKNMFDQHRLSKKFSEPVTPKPCLNPSKDELTRTSENKVPTSGSCIFGNKCHLCLASV